MYVGFFFGKPEEKKPFGKLRHRWKYDIKMDIKNKWKAWTRLILFGTGTSGALLWTRQGNEPSGSTNFGGFCDWLRKYLLVKRNYVPWRLSRDIQAVFMPHRLQFFLYEIIWPMVRFHPNAGLQILTWGKIKVAKKKNSTNPQCLILLQWTQLFGSRWEGEGNVRNEFILSTL